MKETFEKFLNLIKKEKEINICLHDTPDPDAIGSAMGLQYILNKFKIKSIINYTGDISHPQNKTLINILNIPLKKVDKNIEENVICIDSTEKNSCGKKPILVIDHHKNETDAELQIIEPFFGSCCTIIWKLMKELEIEFKDEEANIFTSMLLGIRTDTNDLISEYMVVEDFEAYQDLLNFVDKEALQKIMNYPLPRYLYDKRNVLHDNGNSYESDGVFIGGVGYIQNSQRDVIAILSEEYVRMESINTSIIFAIIDRKSLQVSIRSSNVSLDVGQLCRELFGDYGGGTSHKGGASIPLTFYSDLENGEKDAFWKVTCKTMFKKVLKESWQEEKKEE